MRALNNDMSASLAPRRRDRTGEAASLDPLKMDELKGFEKFEALTIPPGVSIVWFGFRSRRREVTEVGFCKKFLG